ncbi:MAG TPA: hypothetical protein PLV41_08155 [Miltoncostaeales bacterium]|nr:hypothetical protein [Miltoncostaeales bacterium]
MSTLTPYAAAIAPGHPGAMPVGFRMVSAARGAQYCATGFRGSHTGATDRADAMGARQWDGDARRGGALVAWTDLG